MKRLILPLLSGLFIFSSLLSCSHSKKTENSSVVIHVDLEKEDKVSSKDVFSSIRIIPLETDLTEAGISSFRYKLAVTDNAYYVLDQRSCKIICFDSEGKWLQTSDKRGRGKGEFLMSSDFRYDDTDSTLLVLDPRGIVYKYSLEDGLPFISQTIFDADPRAAHSLLPVGGDEYLVFSNSDEHHIFTINTVLQECKAFRYDYHRWLFATPYSYTGSPFLSDNGSVYYYEGLDGSLYTVNTAELSIDKILSWDFGKYQFDVNKLEPGKEVEQYVQFWNDNSGRWATPVHIALVSEKVVLATFFFDNSWRNLVYYRETNECKYFTKFEEGGRFDIGRQYDGRGYLLIPSEYLSQFVNEKMVSDTASIAAINNTRGTDAYVLIEYVL